MKIEIIRDPYGEGFNTCRRKEIDIKPGITVLTSCNGGGKSTAIKCIKENLKNRNINFISYDDYYDGGHNSISKNFGIGNYVMGATLMSSSRGEKININIAEFINTIKYYIEFGESPKRRLFSFEDDKKEEIKSNERWILFDDIDAGYSIDNMIDFIDLLNIIQDSCKDSKLELYIIISSNSFELCRNFRCIDVMEGIEVSFDTYEKFKKFTLRSREKKDNKFKKLAEKEKKEKEKWKVHR